MIYGYIYGLRNRITDRWYIGQTTGNPFEYIRAKYKWSKGTGRPKIYNAIKKYGFNNFDICLLDSSETKESLDNLECQYIKEYNSIDAGYNLTEGGGNGKPSLETREKLSQSHTGKIATKETIEKLRISKLGENNPWFGKTLSVEHREKISQKLKGKVFSEEHKRKLSESNKATKAKNKVTRSVPR